MFVDMISAVLVLVFFLFCFQIVGRFWGFMNRVRDGWGFKADVSIVGTQTSLNCFFSQIFYWKVFLSQAFKICRELVLMMMVGRILPDNRVYCSKGIFFCKGKIMIFGGQLKMFCFLSNLSNKIDNCLSGLGAKMLIRFADVIDVLLQVLCFLKEVNCVLRFDGECPLLKRHEGLSPLTEFFSFLFVRIYLHRRVCDS